MNQGLTNLVETTTKLSTLDSTTIFPAELNMDVKIKEITNGSSIISIEYLSSFTSTDCTALVHALLASFSVILVSELGDKTFIITAIMAMKNSRSLVFLSSAMALFMMTVLSVGMGVAVTVIPKKYTHYASIVLFICFGLKMLVEAYEMVADNKEESEFDEVKRSLENEPEVNDSVKTLAKVNIMAEAPTTDTFNETTPASSLNDDQAIKLTDDAASQTDVSPSWFSRLIQTIYVAPIVMKVFTMIFVAEWGDRSQISTVILAAREDVVGVFVGSLSGHVLCTGLAVIGGRFVADSISVKTMTIIGGLIFLAFATLAIISGPES